MLRRTALIVLASSVILVSSAFLSAAASDDSPAKPAAALPTALPEFMAGTWRGMNDKSFLEEIWSEPRGNNMMGSFRWLKDDGSPAMFELLTLTKDPDVVRMRLRHHTAVLVAKEAVDKPLVFKMVESSANRAVFEAEQDTLEASKCTYERNGDDMTVVVEFGKAAKPRQPLTVKFKKS